jgi:hypothetical protein
VSVVGSLWIGEKFSVFGRAGFFAWKAEHTVSAGNYETTLLDYSKESVSANDNGFEPVFGVGIQTQLDGALVRLEYKQTSIGNLRYTDRGDPAVTTDDFTVFDVSDSELGSLSFSIVWTL